MCSNKIENQGDKRAVYFEAHHMSCWVDKN